MTNTTTAQRLYFDDPHRFAFTANVVRHATHGDKPSVILDVTAFYPEAGGQMGDHGSLNDVSIIDTQEDEGGEVHHIVSGALPAIGSVVNGSVDGDRRRTHMALHTGQHMLSRALLDVANAETVSSRLGETECTIDVSIEKIDDDALHRAEDLVNAVIDSDVSVRAYFPTPDVLATLPLRRAPKVTDNIRVVDVDGFDVSPCGGTHCTRTAQVGSVRIEKIERKKGNARVTFSSGIRLRRALFQEDALLRTLSARFSCGVLDVEGAIEKLQRDLKDARGSFSRVQGQLVERTKHALASELEARDRALVVMDFDDVDVSFLRAVASSAIGAHRTVVMSSATSEGTHVLVMRGERSEHDAGKLLSAMAKRAGGKGGGKSDLAQGKFAAVDDLAALVDLSIHDLAGA